MAEKSVKVVVLGDASSLKRATADSDKALRGLADSSEKNTKRVSVSHIAMGAALGGVFGSLTHYAIDFGKASLEAFTDTEESLNKVNVVFEEASDEIKAFAKSSAKNLGISNRAALDATGTFGNMFDQMKVAPAQSAKMSKALLTLTADLASFHNANPTQIIEAQTAAFRGEYDALQRFIPTINAAAVQQKAMEMTGKTNAQSLTEQEKALATYELMLSGAGKAMGDFSRTADSVANQNRVRAAQWEDTQAAFGAAIAPLVYEIVIPALSRLTTWLNENKESVTGFFRDARQKADEFGQWFTENVGTFDDFKRGMEEVKSTATDMKDSFNSGVEDFRRGGQVITETGFGIATSFMDLGMKAIQLKDYLNIVWDGFLIAIKSVKDMLDPLIGTFQTIWEWITKIGDNEVIKKLTSIAGGGGATGGGVNPLEVARKLGLGFDSGGVVPGYRGQPTMAMVHGGETVLPTHKRSYTYAPTYNGMTAAEVAAMDAANQRRIYSMMAA